MKFVLVVLLTVLVSAYNYEYDFDDDVEWEMNDDFDDFMDMSMEYDDDFEDWSFKKLKNKIKNSKIYKKASSKIKSALNSKAGKIVSKVAKFSAPGMAYSAGKKIFNKKNLNKARSFVNKHKGTIKNVASVIPAVGAARMGVAAYKAASKKYKKYVSKRSRRH
ncbi:hypothetical protein QTN25_007106 [Entamoeba marina]